MTENKKTMVWRNLLKYKCPECFSILERPGDIGPHRCTICNFKINDEKLTSIVASMQKGKQRHRTPSEEDNLSKINNL